MDLKKIREMDDIKLAKFLKEIQSRNTGVCCMCGKLAYKVVKIENKDKFQTKKLCGVCDTCYPKLLNFLGVSDIDWN